AGSNINLLSLETDSVVWNNAKENLASIESLIDSGKVIAKNSDGQDLSKFISEIETSMGNFTEALYSYHDTYMKYKKYRRMTWKSGRDFQKNAGKLLNYLNTDTINEQKAKTHVVKVSNITRGHQEAMSHLWRAEMLHNNEALPALKTR